jgi:hypothetical protein
MAWHFGSPVVTDTGGLPERRGGSDMLATIAGILIVLWLLGFFAFHVTSGMIHIVLVIGLIMLVLHFVTGRSVA